MPPKPEKIEELLIQMRELVQSLVSSQLETFKEQLAGSASIQPDPKTTFSNQPKPPKIILSSFDGSHPLEWLFQA